MNFAPALIAIRMMARDATRRRTEGVWASGRSEYTSGIPVDTPIRAVIQTAKDLDLNQLPEGERFETYKAIWTEAELRTSSDGDETTADIAIDEFGQKFRIINQGFRVEAGFTKCYGRLINDRGRSIPRG